MSSFPMSAVILGIDTPIGLAIIRDLGARGVKVHGIAREARAIGLASRFLAKGYIRVPGEEALIQQLEVLGDKLGEACLYAISESDIALLNRHRPRLTAYKLMFADARRMELVLRKDHTYAAAEKIGIRVPRTGQVRSMEEAADLCASLRFPVVLKWSNPNDVARTLAAAGLSLHKAHYCYSADELLDYLRPYEAVKAYPLIQEYCAGYGLGQIVLMHAGQAYYAFQHKRVHEWPPEGGFSSLCESVPLAHHQSLMEKSIALLRALEWEGVAMVEYRHDPATGESALMEINGRFWGSLPLACHAGASFPWFSYQLFGMGRPVAQEGYRSGIRCRFMIPETKRLMRLMFRQKDIADRHLKFKRIPELAGYLFDFLRPGTCYYVFALSDPRPFLRDMLQTIRQVMPARLRTMRISGKI
jgi:predicted ATP-grasp superfamily ATP-dependent carboligase